MNLEGVGHDSAPITGRSLAWLPKKAYRRHMPCAAAVAVTFGICKMSPFPSWLSVSFGLGTRSESYAPGLNKEHDWYPANQETLESDRLCTRGQQIGWSGKLVIGLFIYLFIYLLFRATPVAYGGSQASG